MSTKKINLHELSKDRIIQVAKNEIRKSAATKWGEFDECQVTAPLAMCYLKESFADHIIEPIAENALKQLKARSMTVQDTKKPWSSEFVVGRALAVAARNHAYADFHRIMSLRNYKEFESRAVEFATKGEREPFDNIGVVTTSREWGEEANADLSENL